MGIRTCIIALALVGGLATAHAADLSAAEAAVGEGVDLSQLRRLAAERNPQLARAKALWQATIEKYPQATALPDPMVVFDFFGASVETRVGPQEYRYGVSQSFPFPGTLKQAGEVVRQEVRVQHAVFDLTVRQVMADLELSYHELLYLRSAQELAGQNEDLLAHILKVANSQYAAGAAKLADVLKAQSQLAQLSYDRILLAELEQVEIARINALLELPGTTPIGKCASPPLRIIDLTIAEIEACALAGRPELEVSAGEIARAADNIRLAALRNRPSFTLNAMRIETGEARHGNPSDSGRDPWLIGFGLRLPIWGQRNRSSTREAEFRHEAAAANRRQLEDQTRADVRALYFRLENARRLIELYEKSLIPQAAQAMEIAEQWQNGETRDVSGFLETQSVWLNFNLARLRAVTDYQQYRTRLERLTGGPLPSAAEKPE